MAAQPLQPGAGHNATHGETQQINGLIGPKVLLDPISQALRQNLKGRKAQAMGQMGDPQIRTPPIQTGLQTAKQLGGVPQAVHQN
jgi:hypothetical protein